MAREKDAQLAEYLYHLDRINARPGGSSGCGSIRKFLLRYDASAARSPIPRRGDGRRRCAASRARVAGIPRQLHDNFSRSNSPSRARNDDGRDAVAANVGQRPAFAHEFVDAEQQRHARSSGPAPICVVCRTRLVPRLPAA